MIIYLTRHGQTTGDIEGRYGGDYDDHLTDEGKQQSATLARQLHGKDIEKLYASPRLRAQETAAIIGKGLGLEVTTLGDFRERNGYGILTGLTKTEAKAKYPALDTLSHEPLQTVAVVTHGGPLRLIYRNVLQLGEIDVADCAHAVVEAKNGTYKLVASQGITVK